MINTNGINVNFPVAGEDNPTQGFRDNFTSIKTGLDQASTELADLQSKVILKAPLSGSSLSNDMANVLISNAAVKGFRTPTYNLGNALSGSVVINVSQADVQYGTVTGNTSLSFSRWSPTGTESKLTLKLAVSNSSAVINFPSQVIASNNNFGGTILENSVVGNNISITVPYDVTQLDFLLKTSDCGNTISIEPLNRPFKTTQVQVRSPSPTGLLGDTQGTAAIDESYIYVCTANYDATTITSLSGLSTNATGNLITFNSDVAAANVTVNMPVVFDTMQVNNVSVTSFGGISSGQFYYVKDITGSTITISDTRSAGVAGNVVPLTTVASGANTSMDATFYDGSDIWKRVSLTSW